jgi:hypothetical protein
LRAPLQDNPESRKLKKDYMALVGPNLRTKQRAFRQEYLKGEYQKFKESWF